MTASATELWRRRQHCVETFEAAARSSAADSAAAAKVSAPGSRWVRRARSSCRPEPTPRGPTQVAVVVWLVSASAPTLAAALAPFAAGPARACLAWQSAPRRRRRAAARRAWGSGCHASWGWSWTTLAHARRVSGRLLRACRQRRAHDLLDLKLVGRCVAQAGVPHGRRPPSASSDTVTPKQTAPCSRSSWRLLVPSRTLIGARRD